MSKICIVLVKDISGLCHTTDWICSKIRHIINSYALGMFIIDPIMEPFGDKYVDCVAISIADNDSSDNCEMFLLPDNCSFNGRINGVQFIERMKVLRDIALCLGENDCWVELFIGDSGVNYEDYAEACCKANDLPHVLQELYYVPSEWNERCLHMKII